MVGEHRKKHRFNLVDIFLILVIILCIVGIALRSNLEKAFVTETVQIDITCRLLDNAVAGTVDLIKKDAPLYLSDGELFGSCKSIDPATNTIVIKCTVELENSVYMRNSTKISCNRTLKLHTDLLSFDALVLNITESN